MSFHSLNLPCGYTQSSAAAARRQKKKYANYSKVVLEILLIQALKSIKKYPKECVGFFSEQRNVSAAVSAGVLPVRVCVCVLVR